MCHYHVSEDRGPTWPHHIRSRGPHTQFHVHAVLQPDSCLVITTVIITQHVLRSTMRALWLFFADGSQAPQIIADISFSDVVS